MSGFLLNIISRHANSENTVSPRLRSLFEQSTSIPPQWSASPFQGVEENTNTSEENQYDESEKEGSGPQLEKENNVLPQRKLEYPKNEKKEMPTENPTSGKKVSSFLKKANPPVQPFISPGQKEDASNSGPQKMVERLKNPDQKENSKEDVIREVPEKTYFSSPIQISKEGNSSTYRKAKSSILKGPPLEPHLFAPSDPVKVPENFKRKNPTFKKVLEPIRKHHSPLSTQDFFGHRNHQISMPDQQSLTSIKIHIGRIEIKAVSQQPNSKRKSPDPSKPRISLNQFLEKKGK